MSTTEQRAVARRALQNSGLSMPALVAWVAVAGAAGAVLRLLIGAPLEEQFMKFPWATLVINLSGSAALGLLLGLAHAWPQIPRWTVPVLGTGLLGSFTTFSTVMLAAVASQSRELFTQTAGDDVIPAGAWEMLAYLGVSMLFCTAAAASGVTVGRALFGCSGMDCNHSAPAPPPAEGEPDGH